MVSNNITGNLKWYEENVKTPRVLELEAQVAGLEKRLEAAVAGLCHIKAWAEQSQVALNALQVAEAVARMCDDAMAAAQPERRRR
jgi:hypothetical protein